MENTFPLTGTVIEIGEVKVLSPYFSKREFKLRYTDTDFKNKIKENKILLNVQNEDMELLDAVRVDDIVNIRFYIDGRDIMKKDQSGIINFTTLVCYQIDILSSPSRNTDADRNAIITNDGKTYKDPLVPASDEQLAGIVHQEPLLAYWETKKDKYGLKIGSDGKNEPFIRQPEDNPFPDIEENKEYKNLPF